MRKNLSGWVLGALAIALTSTFMACKGGVNEPTPVPQPGMDDEVIGIQGYVEESTSPNRIPGAKVTWYCMVDPEPIEIGFAYTEGDGHYTIYYQDWWAEHDGHDFVGWAEAEGYKSGCSEIIDFQSTAIYYVRHFYLDPE